MWRPTILPDTNIWRYIVDADEVEPIRMASKAAGVAVIACPAVVYECLRGSDAVLRRRLAKAITRSDWLRPMPEAYVETDDLHNEIRRLRPEWLTQKPDLRNWYRNRADWQGDFWRRARHDTNTMARIIARLDGATMEQARTQARAARGQARDLRHTTQTLRLSTAQAVYSHNVPGWDGSPFPAWRGLSEAHWWESLLQRRDNTALEWLEPWVDLQRIRTDRRGWVRFWTREVGEHNLPREWLRWAMTEVQALRKITPGTPVDNQIATYLADFDVFVTADRAFADCVEVMRPDSPVPLAETSVSPAGSAAVQHLMGAINELGSRRTASSP